MSSRFLNYNNCPPLQSDYCFPVEIGRVLVPTHVGSQDILPREITQTILFPWNYYTMCYYLTEEIVREKLVLKM